MVEIFLINLEIIIIVNEECFDDFIVKLRRLNIVDVIIFFFVLEK